MNQTGSEWDEPPKVPVLDSPTNCWEGAHPSWLFASNTRHVLAVVSRLDAKGVKMIGRWAEQGREVTIRMVVLVHATCPTRSEDLAALVMLADSHPGKLKVLVRPLSHWGEELTWVRLD